MIRKVRAAVDLDAPASAIFELLTEFDHLADWVPGITDARVLATEGDISVAEFTVPRRTVVLEILASPPQALQFSTVSELRKRTITGGWQLSEKAAGKGAVLDVRIAFASRLFDFGARRRMRDALETALAAVRQQVARVIRKAPPTGVLRRKILEVIRHQDGIRVWVEGEVYELSKHRGEADG